MDELSAFAGAPAGLRDLESELLRAADVVLTGGSSLFQAKRERHDSVHLFPSSVDQAHFGRAQGLQSDPPDQADIPHPRLGFFGVIDERMDMALIEGLAKARPDWQIVLVGPVVKIATESLPRRENIHYLGIKSYDELPAYLSGWDVALLPFAHNPSTRFISPTKTLEYLAAGKPVVSTSIADVVEPYGKEGLVRIADTVPDFVAATEQALLQDGGSMLPQINALLTRTSWDLTWQRMKQVIDGAMQSRTRHGLQAETKCLTISS